jgi:hypothetical protein
MSPDKDVTIAARVRPDLKADVETVRARLGEKDASVIVRRALTEYVDKVLERGQAGPGGLLPTTFPVNAGGALTAETMNAALESMGASIRVRDVGADLLTNGRRGAHRRRPTPTEEAAALAQIGRAGTARRLALEAFERASTRGLTADEVVVELLPRPHNGTARRVTDLLQGGLIEVRMSAGKVVERNTRAGSRATVYVINEAGKRALAERRQSERVAA